MICVDLNEFKRDNESRKNFKLYSRELFEFVNNFLKITILIEFNIEIIFSKINVDFAIDILVKKNRFDVHLL